MSKPCLHFVMAVTLGKILIQDKTMNTGFMTIKQVENETETTMVQREIWRLKAYKKCVIAQKKSLVYSLLVTLVMVTLLPIWSKCFCGEGRMCGPSKKRMSSRLQKLKEK